MDKSIQKRITLQPYSSLSHLNLTNFPLGNLRNPGIGLSLFDVMIPLHGVEKFEQKKEDSVMLGSHEDKPQALVTQEGFGSNLNKDINTTNEPLIPLTNTVKINKLGAVFDAMQNAKIDTKKYVFKPIKNKNVKKRAPNVHKFSFI